MQCPYTNGGGMRGQAGQAGKPAVRPDKRLAAMAGSDKAAPLSTVPSTMAGVEPPPFTPPPAWHRNCEGKARMPACADPCAPKVLPAGRCGPRSFGLPAFLAGTLRIYLQ